MLQFLLWIAFLLQNKPNPLNPNSILHIAIFIHLCEAFLGVRPYFSLFRHLIVLRPLPSIKDQDVIGGAGLQLRNKDIYLDVSLPGVWNGSIATTIRRTFPIFLLSLQPPKPSWIEKPNPVDEQIQFLLRKIAKLKQSGVDGTKVACNFVSR